MLASNGLQPCCHRYNQLHTCQYIYCLFLFEIFRQLTVTARTGIKLPLRPQGDQVIRAKGPAPGINGPRLGRWSIKLELLVGSD